MSKFQMGEIVVLHTARRPGPVSSVTTLPAEVEIVQVFNPPILSRDGFPCEYAIRHPATSAVSGVMEWQLRKRPQPGIPQSVLNIFRLPVEA